MHRFSVITLFVLLLLGGCREFPVDPLPGQQQTAPRDFEVTPDQAFEFRIGDIVHVEGTEFFIHFRLVVSDSRCPSNVECVHPGQADVLLIVSNSRDDAEYQVLASVPGQVAQPFLAAARIQFESIAIQMLGLSPYPVAGVPVRDRDVVATMRISVDA